VQGAEFFLSDRLAEWWEIIVGGLFIFVVLVMRDGIVGTIMEWVQRRRLGSYRQMVEEADRTAHDLQVDWRAEGAPRSGEEVR
jgi:hypothetical protein